MNKKFKLIISMYIVFMFIFILPSCFSFFGQAFAKTLAPGEGITIPSNIETYTATYEKEDINWGAVGQAKVNELWKSQGKPKDENNWAYVTMFDKQWHIVALAQSYGVSGDYVAITVENGDVQTTYNCIIGDSKRKHEIVDGIQIPDNTMKTINGVKYPGAFWARKDGTLFLGADICEDEDNYTQYGHYYDGKCNVLELILADYTSTPDGNFLNDIGHVVGIQNGGSYLRGEDPSQYLTGSYGTLSGAVNSQITFWRNNRYIF